MLSETKKKAGLKKGDNVVIIAGKEKGKNGKVLRVDVAKGSIFVERINVQKKHVKPTQKSQGGILDKEGPIAVSNVMLFCGKCLKGVKTRKKVIDDGSKVRVCIKCGEEFA